MRNKCHHRWVEIARYYTPPASDRVSKFSNATEELAQQIFFGLTNIELECSICNDIKVTTVPGICK